jgi:hypothetical protein
VQRQAVQVSEQWNREVGTSLSGVEDLPTVNGQVDVNDRFGAEILLFEDGIQVKQQKESRVRRSEAESGLEEMKEPLNLVTISDGAKTIRLRLLEIFGVATTVILDWYHLSKKLRELMSMIARNKVEKSMHLRELFKHLWHGRVEEALAYLRTQVQSRNEEKLAELVGYLEKHRTEIIDYERRKQAGKSIGSGRVEKGVDQVIGHRQKEKGTSWRPKGSKALAILKILELNGQWQQTWFPTKAQ